MSRRLRYSPEALAQLNELEDHLVERAGRVVANAYLDRLLDFCDRLVVSPIAGGHLHDNPPELQ